MHTFLRALRSIKGIPGGNRRLDQAEGKRLMGKRGPMDMQQQLTPRQSLVLSTFYAMPETRVVFPKSERGGIWEEFKRRGDVKELDNLRIKCPALAIEIERARDSESHIQSAVFSECSYAQTLANQLQLNNFHDIRETSDSVLPTATVRILRESGLAARYAYLNHDKSTVLIQAGGHGGIDSLLISNHHNEAIRLEFKEPHAKTSEPDLPRYGEDGLLRVDEAWLSKYPQFKDMVTEQVRQELNFFMAAGSNINDFTPMSVERAVRDNYQGAKFADVFLTEDERGYLTLIPSTDASTFGRLKGEIRPAGRNPYPVWTPGALAQVIREKGGEVTHDLVSMPLSAMTPASPRGGTGISRYKLNPLFFVYEEDAQVDMSQVRFSIHNVRQLKPTISAHMDFRGMDVHEVREFYLGGQ